MSQGALNTLADIARRVGRHPEEAFAFVREGLNFAVERIHGEEKREHHLLYRVIAERDWDWDDLAGHYHQGSLPATVVAMVDAVGGPEKLNRHVGGRELCWGLRDFALKRWGMLARTVLSSWNIHETADFGRIVFAFIECEVMQKEPQDREEDFADVYDFDEAFDAPYTGGVLQPLDD